MITTIIIDDEVNNREKLRNQLIKYCPFIEIVAEADGVISGISAIRIEKPDLIFLDISMGDGSGFDLLNRFDTIDFKVIFVTAYEEFALKAFRFSAVDYLLKPVDPDELIEAVKKVTNQLSQERNKQLNILSEIILSGRFKKIALKDSDNIHLINIADIIHCESDGSYVRFYILNEKEITISKQLKEYEELLADSGFFRVHKSHLINMAHAKRFEKADGGFVVMSDESRIPVASRKREQLLELFDKF
jgi:two-component system, LytTR family, response regulator